MPVPEPDAGRCLSDSSRIILDSSRTVPESSGSGAEGVGIGGDWSRFANVQPRFFNVFRTDSSAWSCQSCTTRRCPGCGSSQRDSMSAGSRTSAVSPHRRPRAICVSVQRPTSPRMAFFAVQCANISSTPIANPTGIPRRSARSSVFGCTSIPRFIRASSRPTLLAAHSESARRA